MSVLACFIVVIVLWMGFVDGKGSVMVGCSGCLHEIVSGKCVVMRAFDCDAFVALK